MIFGLSDQNLCDWIQTRFCNVRTSCLNWFYKTLYRICTKIIHKTSRLMSESSYPIVQICPNSKSFKSRDNRTRMVKPNPNPNLNSDINNYSNFKFRQKIMTIPNFFGSNKFKYSNFASLSLAPPSLWGPKYPSRDVASSLL